VSRELKEFAKDLRVGQEYEERFLVYLKQFFEVRKATIEQQLQGIDFVVRKPEGDSAVELKADRRTADTGNIFVETMSRYEHGVMGWAWTTRSDILIYWALPSTLYIAKPSDIRDALTAKDDGWIYRFPKKLVCNKGYHSEGIVVPTDEYAKICTVRSIDA
jgi:hypothetical protein